MVIDSNKARKRKVKDAHTVCSSLGLDSRCREPRKWHDNRIACSAPACPCCMCWGGSPGRAVLVSSDAVAMSGRRTAVGTARHDREWDPRPRRWSVTYLRNIGSSLCCAFSSRGLSPFLTMLYVRRSIGVHLSLLGLLIFISRLVHTAGTAK